MSESLEESIIKKAYSLGFALGAKQGLKVGYNRAVDESYPELGTTKSVQDALWHAIDDYNSGERSDPSDY